MEKTRQAVVNVARVADKVISNYDRATRKMSVVVFQAIARLTIEQDEHEDLKFTPLQVASKVSELIGKDWVRHLSEEDIARRVRQAWNQFVEKFESLKDGFVEAALNDHCDYYPIPAKDSGGGAGNMSLYFLTPAPIPNTRTNEKHDDPALKESPLNIKAIRYIPEQVEKPSIFAKAIAHGFTMTGWRRFIYVSSISLLLIIFLLLLFFLYLVVIWSTLPARELFKTALGVSALCGVIWVSFGSLFLVGERRIVMAPGWMIRWSDISSPQLEMRVTNPHMEKPEKILMLVRYSSKCSICGGRVVVKNGGREFYGRLIGSCNESPKEHVFSFDHVTRQGQALRS